MFIDKNNLIKKLKFNGVKSLTDMELVSIIIGDNNITNKINLKNININYLVKNYNLDINKASMLVSSLELGKRICLMPGNKLIKLNNPKAIFNYTKNLFFNMKQEYFYCLYFNTKQELISKKLLFIGTVNSSVIHTREIFKEAYLNSASGILCIHNHPSGDITPSKADIYFTTCLFKTGTIQGIPIIDHIIVSDDNYYSFKEHLDILNI